MAAPIYDTTVKTARMTATRDVFAGGDVQLLAANDDVLLTAPLSAAGGTVSGATWTFQFGAESDATITVTASGGGTGTAATKARMRDSGGTVRLTGITVGLAGSGAGVIVGNTSIATGQSVTVGPGELNHAPDPE
jgi:hypothetical protein